MFDYTEFNEVNPVIYGTFIYYHQQLAQIKRAEICITVTSISYLFISNKSFLIPDSFLLPAR